MQVRGAAIAELQQQVQEIRNRHPNLKPDDAFVAWFFQAYVTDREDLALDAVAGGSHDKGIDGVLIDDRSRSIFIVQAKYRHHLAAKTESRNDVLNFSKLALELSDDDATRDLLQGMGAHTKILMRRAHNKLVKDNYKLWLYYVTLGKVSTALIKEATSVTRKARTEASLEILAGRRLLLLLRDYLDGAAPPIPTLDLPMEKSSQISVNGILQRFDRSNDIESWVFSMKGSSVANMFNLGGVRLFARNIRGFVGESTSVNKKISKTLTTEPDHFFYYNNGITIVCDRAEKRSSNGRDLLRVSNPQIINGQQTCRMLATHQKESDAASVLVKVMQVPREDGRTPEGFERLVSNIVDATNSQNAVKPSDLITNDRRQIDLERSFRKLGYTYLRKRQTKGEVREQFGGKKYLMIKKEDLAQAVAGCDLDPVVARSGKENLFSNKDLYETVFSYSEAEAYLARYWLTQEVTAMARGAPQRGYLKWLVLGFVWKQLSPHVQGRTKARQFRAACEREEPLVVKPLSVAIDKAYRAAQKYYDSNKGRGPKAIDISLFFRSKKGRQNEFASYWSKKEAASRHVFNGAIKKSVAAIHSYEL